MVVGTKFPISYLSLGFVRWLVRLFLLFLTCKGDEKGAVESTRRAFTASEDEGSRSTHVFTSPIYRTSSFKRHLLGVCSRYHSRWLPYLVSGVSVSPSESIVLLRRPALVLFFCNYLPSYLPTLHLFLSSSLISSGNSESVHDDAGYIGPWKKKISLLFFFTNLF